MAEPTNIPEPTASQKEQVAYERCLRIYRSEGKTPEEIAALLKDHPGRPAPAKVKEAAAALANAVPVVREAAKGPATGGKAPAKRGAQPIPPAQPAKGVPIIPGDAGGPPSLDTLPAAMAAEDWNEDPAAAAAAAAAEAGDGQPAAE